MIIHGDCLDYMVRCMEPAAADLVYADPPFNTGKDWGAFDDRWDSMDDYVEWLTERMRECKRVLKPTGSLWLHCDPTSSHYIKVALDEVLGRNNFRNEVVWCYTGAGAPGQRQFSRKHDTLFWYSMGKTWTFNADDVRVPYSIGSIERVGSRKRWTGEGDGGKCKLKDGGKIPEDYWVEAKGNGLTLASKQKKQYVGYPTQKPVALLERIILACSNEGDLVLDPFCGSGTTLVAAKRLNRRHIGIDVSEEACEIAENRIAA